MSQITKIYHLQNPSAIIILLFVINSTTEATIDSLDWSNVDPWNFQYFKYPKTTQRPIIIHKNGLIFAIRKIPEKPNHIVDTFNRAKAAFKYLSGIAFGNADEKIRRRYVLDPEFGKKRRKNYEAKYGKNGENLIEFLGSNPRLEDLVRADVI